MQSAWENIKDQMANELPERLFSLWVNPITLLDKQDRRIILACPNKFARKWVMEHYLDIIQDKLRQAGAAHVNLVSRQRHATGKRPGHPFPSTSVPILPPPFCAHGEMGRPFLNRRFTFDRFIAGRSSRVAYAAAKAIAHGSFPRNQILLIQADTGLGKTHLCQAAAHAILNRHPHTRVNYFTVENATDRRIFSLTHNQMEESSRRFCQYCDILIVEGIHLLGGKEGAQKALRSVLGAMADGGRKCIVTSCLPLGHIPKFSKELASRLACGKVTTISKPGYETRKRILKIKASEDNLRLSKQVRHFLAGRLGHDVRHLESALMSLKARAAFVDVKIDARLAKEVTACLFPAKVAVSPGEIQKGANGHDGTKTRAAPPKDRKSLREAPQAQPNLRLFHRI